MSDWVKANELGPDYEDGSMIPCVLCGIGHQIGGTGFCSQQCETELLDCFKGENK